MADDPTTPTTHQIVQWLLRDVCHMEDWQITPDLVDFVAAVYAERDVLRQRVKELERNHA